MNKHAIRGHLDGHMAVSERLDGFQRKHPWAGFPLAVLYKYVDDFGAYLAALLTYYGCCRTTPVRAGSGTWRDRRRGHLAAETNADASAVMRKARATAAHTTLPLAITTTHRPDSTP
jgi:hypothetical protein